MLVTVIYTRIMVLLLNVVRSWRRMTSLITFHFLFQFVLTNEALMFRCIIVIREDLCE